MVLFGAEYLKVWWNYGEDFKVLDATIAHMFQGTPRERFWTIPMTNLPNGFSLLSRLVPTTTVVRDLTI
jgi:hypothetical protein